MDLVKGTVAKYFHKRLMICDNQEVLAALCEIFSLLEPLGYRQRFALDGSITLFSTG